jgi:hypothetical protein
VQDIFFEHIVDTTFFYAQPAASGAVLPEFDCGVFTDGVKTRLRLFDGYVILFGHGLFQMLNVGRWVSSVFGPFSKKSQNKGSGLKLPAASSGESSP